VSATAPDVIASVRRRRTGLLPWAAAQGAANAIELLVSVGFDVNARGRSDVAGNQPWHTALHVAAEKGDVALARKLLDLGADPNIPDKHHNSTPLGWARYFRQQAMIDLLEPVTGHDSPPPPR
jgi:ankyrin repeat protein